MNLDEIDREIVRLLQADASLTARELAEHVGLTATPVWRRVQILESAGVITGRVALVDPEALGLGVTVMVHVRTNDHSAAWLDRFAAAIEDLPEIIEAYRISGEIDYTLKVVVPSIEAYDDFYKRLIGRVELYDVRSVLSLIHI